MLARQRSTTKTSDESKTTMVVFENSRRHVTFVLKHVSLKNIEVMLTSQQVAFCIQPAVRSRQPN